MAKKDAVAKGDYLDASFILDKPKKITTISPAVDIMLYGGWPDSTIGVLESKPKIGKTTLALKIGAKAQQQHGKIVVYVSVENRLSIKNLMGVRGLDISADKFKIIASQQDDILSTEDILEKAEKALIDFPGCIMIFDSFSSLSSKAEKSKGYGEGYGGIDSRKLEGEFARRISPIIQVNGSSVIGIAHMTPSMTGRGSNIKISQAMLYQMDILLSLKRAFPDGDWKQGEKIIGQKISMYCETSALGPPGGEANGYLRYGTGFSDEAEIAELAIDLKIIEKGGAWYSYVPQEIKAQGFTNLVDSLEAKPEACVELLGKIKEVLQ